MPVVTKEHNQCIVLAVSKMFSFFLKKKKNPEEEWHGSSSEVLDKYWLWNKNNFASNNVLSSNHAFSNFITYNPNI